MVSNYSEAADSVCGLAFPSPHGGYTFQSINRLIPCNLSFKLPEFYR